MKEFQEILKAKRDYYGNTEAAIQFAANEFADQFKPKLIELYNDEELPTKEVLCVNALNKMIVGTIRSSLSGFFMCDDRFGNSHMNIIGYFKLPELP